MTPYDYGYQDGLNGAYNNLYDTGTVNWWAYEEGHYQGNKSYENVR